MITILTRFALVTRPDLNRYVVTRKLDFGTAQKTVFSQLNRRLDLLLGITAPSVAAMTGAYRWVILTSEALPDRIAARLPVNAEIRRMKPDETLLALDFNGPTANLDSDDALCPDFPELVARRMRNGHAISLDTGWYLARGYHVGARTVPQINIGWTWCGGNVYQLGNHMKADVPVISLAGKPYWIRTVHDVNDSGVNAEALLKSKSKSYREARKMMKDFPSIGKVLQVI